MKPLTLLSSLADTLACPRCGKTYEIDAVQTFASCCNQPLVVEYDLENGLSKERLKGRNATMWRYAELLPLQDPGNMISLGEGMTPIFPLHNLAALHQLSSVFIKDESVNPTGSFKARGISMAVSRAKELGIRRCIIPTAGNAGGALAAYCAKAGMDCLVVMPRHTPSIFKTECAAYGAELVLVDGLINDCARKVAEICSKEDYFDMSTLKEPYRLEGKKTMGFEIAEQFNWRLPDVIIYPAGGGTGLIGIWKAFRELLAMGWISGPLPRMMAAQAANCAPLAAAMKDPLHWKKNFRPQPSIANGLAVPFPFGMDLMQTVINESGGRVVAISEKSIISGIKEVASTEGMLLSPEGSATWKSLEVLLQEGRIHKNDRILLLNTGSGYKYLENFNGLFESSLPDR